MAEPTLEDITREVYRRDNPGEELPVFNGILDKILSPMVLLAYKNSKNKILKNLMDQIQNGYDPMVGGESFKDLLEEKLVNKLKNDYKIIGDDDVDADGNLVIGTLRVIAQKALKKVDLRRPDYLKFALDKTKLDNSDNALTNAIKGNYLQANPRGGTVFKPSIVDTNHVSESRKILLDRFGKLYVEDWTRRYSGEDNASLGRVAKSLSKFSKLLKIDAGEPDLTSKVERASLYIRERKKRFGALSVGLGILNYTLLGGMTGLISGIAAPVGLYAFSKWGAHMRDAYHYVSGNKLLRGSVALGSGLLGGWMLGGYGLACAVVPEAIRIGWGLLKKRGDHKEHNELVRDNLKKAFVETLPSQVMAHYAEGIEGFIKNKFARGTPFYSEISGIVNRASEDIGKTFDILYKGSRNAKETIDNLDAIKGYLTGRYESEKLPLSVRLMPEKFEAARDNIRKLSKDILDQMGPYRRFNSIFAEAARLAPMLKSVVGREDGKIKGKDMFEWLKTEYKAERNRPGNNYDHNGKTVYSEWYLLNTQKAAQSLLTRNKEKLSMTYLKLKGGLIEKLADPLINLATDSDNDSHYFKKLQTVVEKLESDNSTLYNKNYEHFRATIANAMDTGEEKKPWVEKLKKGALYGGLSALGVLTLGVPMAATGVVALLAGSQLYKKFKEKFVKDDVYNLYHAFIANKLGVHRSRLTEPMLRLFGTNAEIKNALKDYYMNDSDEIDVRFERSMKRISRQQDQAAFGMGDITRKYLFGQKIVERPYVKVKQLMVEDYATRKLNKATQNGEIVNNDANNKAKQRVIAKLKNNAKNNNYTSDDLGAIIKIVGKKYAKKTLDVYMKNEEVRDVMNGYLGSGCPNDSYNDITREVGRSGLSAGVKRTLLQFAVENYMIKKMRTAGINPSAYQRAIEAVKDLKVNETYAPSETELGAIINRDEGVESLDDLNTIKYHKRKVMQHKRKKQGATHETIEIEPSNGNLIKTGLGLTGILAGYLTSNPVPLIVGTGYVAAPVLKKGYNMLQPVVETLENSGSTVGRGIAKVCRSLEHVYETKYKNDQSALIAPSAVYTAVSSVGYSILGTLGALVAPVVGIYKSIKAKNESDETTPKPVPEPVDSVF